MSDLLGMVAATDLHLQQELPFSSANYTTSNAYFYLLHEKRCEAAKRANHLFGVDWNQKISLALQTNARIMYVGGRRSSIKNLFPDQELKSP